MNKDIRLSVSFFHHPKTIKLQSLLGSEGVLSLLRLWCYAGQWKPSGDLGGMNQEEIEGAALFVGSSGMFVQVLLEVKFLNADLTLHDWQEHNPWAAGSSKRSDMARFSRMADTHPKIFKDLRDKGVNAVTRKEYETLTEPQRNVNGTLTEEVTKRLTPSPSPSPAPKTTPLVLPDWLDKELWDAFMEVRKKKRAPNTDRALKLNLDKLAEFQAKGQDPNEVLKQSIEKGYQGLFEVKGTTNAFPPSATQGSVPAYKRGGA